MRLVACFDYPYQALRDGPEAKNASLYLHAAKHNHCSLSDFLYWQADNMYFFYTPFYERFSNPGIRFGEAIANAHILVAASRT